VINSFSFKQTKGQGQPEHCKLSCQQSYIVNEAILFSGSDIDVWTAFVFVDLMQQMG
jgi:hypothetical protein